MSMLVNRGDEIWLEEANTSNVPTAIHMAGGKSVFVPVDEEGLSVDIGRTLAPQARMVVVNPYSAYPAGKVMSLKRRTALLSWAEQAGAIIIEDDYGSEFLFSGRPVPAICALDDYRRTFYIGTFSNYLFPSLRLNYIIAPPALAARIVAIRYKLEFHPPMGLQPVVASFLSEGHLARHARRMLRVYSARREALRDAFAEHLSETFELDLPWAGLNGLARLRRALPEPEERALVHRAMRHGVGLTLLRCRYYQAMRGTEFLVGFGAPNEAEIRAGAQRLAVVMAETNA
jgi:GntR family transcriptional regulator/MocR family aminotransferase